MLKQERQSKLVDFINREQFVRIEALADLTNFSLITIRRDIQELSDAGLIQKVHGGVKSKENLTSKIDVSVLRRKVENTDAKNKIAAYLASKIANNSKIYLDAGSTVSCLIPLLKDRGISVYTHGIHHLPALVEHHIPTNVIGGQLKESTMANIGAKTVKEIEMLRFDFGILGVNAIDANFGLSTPDEEEGLVKRAIIRSSAVNYVLADNSKFDTESFYQFATANDQLLIISDFSDDEKKYKSYNIEIVKQ